MVTLSKRLTMIASMVSSGTVAADIGTDHGFVPIFLVQSGKVARAIASDVRKGPLERAKKHVEEAGLGEIIDCRLGNGLETLKAGEADRVILAGMGGELIVKILAASPEIVSGTPEFVLSPHSDVALVRAYLSGQGFTIADEEMVREDGKFYTAIRAVRENGAALPESREGRNEKLTEDELLFGPVLLKKRPPVFAEWLERERRKTKEILRKLEKAEKTDRVLEQTEEKRSFLQRVERVSDGAAKERRKERRKQQ